MEGSEREQTVQDWSDIWKDNGHNFPKIMKDSKTESQEVKRTQSRIKTYKPYTETYHTQTAEKD